MKSCNTSNISSSTESTVVQTESRIYSQIPITKNVSQDITVTPSANKIVLKNKKKKIQSRYLVQCSNISDGSIDTDNLRTFLHNKLASKIGIGLNDNSLMLEAKGTKILVKCTVAFKKSSLKYFLKKFLKSKKLRRSISVNAHPNIKTAYILNIKNK
ncbi:60S ribosomal protein L22 [Pseudolycoriella hygida]|uniref:60S ribosomal protein L22 n=1 Tax=Pseudolycoriella hygida TaxID=35572 RepID=A0A9Q0MHL2_9DIPT|nr:60S ribosomal protein L22 [Pseudolycoriella hygida]KAJ6616194.1 60S ribosomal protein L22 [Pseudolycoriella hygida]